MFGINRAISRIPLPAKLMIIGLIPLIFLIFMTVQLYQEKSDRLQYIADYRDHIQRTNLISQLIDALQEERKYSFDFVLSKTERPELVLQRPKTDAIIKKLVETPESEFKDLLKFTMLSQLSQIRKQIDTGKISSGNVMHFYSHTIFRLHTLHTLPPRNTTFLKSIYQDLASQKLLSEMTTYFGFLRSSFYNMLYTKKDIESTLYVNVGTLDLYRSFETEYLSKASPAAIDEYKSVRDTTALRPTLDFISASIKNFSIDNSFTAAEWWKVADQGDDALRNLQARIWKRLDAGIEKLYKDEQNAQDRTLGLVVLALISAVSIISYMLFLINRSVNEIAAAAEKLARGKTGIEVRTNSPDAIGNMAEAIRRIDYNNREIVSAATAIGIGDFDIDVNPRGEDDLLGNAIIKMKNELLHYSQHMEELIEIRTRQLARSNEDLQQFAHVASHDLKEPLRKIATFSNMLMNEQKNVLTERGALYLDKIEAASTRMSTMIEGVLAYSTLASGSSQSEPVNLVRLLEDVESDLELVIIQKQAEIRYGKLGDINGIPLLLHQLFYNLINNSLKFAREDRKPVINISSEIKTDANFGKVNHITVSDNGIGFHQEYADKVFAVFSRLNPKEQYEGTGLGLALCKKIVQRHNGNIYAVSAEGEGATFHILLPV